MDGSRLELGREKGHFAYVVVVMKGVPMVDFVLIRSLAAVTSRQHPTDASGHADVPGSHTEEGWCSRLPYRRRLMFPAPAPKKGRCRIWCRILLLVQKLLHQALSCDWHHQPCVPLGPGHVAGPQTLRDVDACTQAQNRERLHVLRLLRGEADYVLCCRIPKQTNELMFRNMRLIL